MMYTVNPALLGNMSKKDKEAWDEASGRAKLASALIH